MCIVRCLTFVTCSFFLTKASILDDLQEAQNLVDQLDYDYAVDAAQRPSGDLLWYDYGGGTGSPAVLIGGGADKRGVASQSNSNQMWFGPRLGRKKRRGGAARPIDMNAVGQGVQSQDASLAMGLTPATGQVLLSDPMPWVLVPIIENSLYGRLKQQNIRAGRSSSEDGDDEEVSALSSRHTARSPPFSPPFSPRLGRQVSPPFVPRLGREALLYRREARGAGALYQQNAAALLRQQRQAASTAVATESGAAVAVADARHQTAVQ